MVTFRMRAIRRLTLLACAALATGTATGCNVSGEKGQSGSTTDTDPPLQATGPDVQPREAARGPEVQMRGVKFVPASIQAAAGQTVSWKNADAVPHTVVARSGARFASKVLEPGGRFSYKVRTAGTIRYVCTLHPNMTGTIVAR